MQLYISPASATVVPGQSSSFFVHLDTQGISINDIKFNLRVPQSANPTNNAIVITGGSLLMNASGVATSGLFTGLTLDPLSQLVFVPTSGILAANNVFTLSGSASGNDFFARFDYTVNSAAPNGNYGISFVTSSSATRVTDGITFYNSANGTLSFGNATITVVPEPSTYLGLAAVSALATGHFLASRRKKKQSANRVLVARSATHGKNTFW